MGLKKEYFALLVGILLIMSVLSVNPISAHQTPEDDVADIEEEITSNEVEAEGSGTENDPYLIENWTHLDSMRENLSAHYKLNSTLNESSAGYNELVDTEQGWDPIGAENISLDFDGSDDYVYAEMSAWDLGQEFSKGMFINTTYDGAQSISGYTTSLTPEIPRMNQFYMNSNGKVTFRSYDGSEYTVTSTSQINDGDWHHIFMTREHIGGGDYEVSIYIDGVKEKTEVVGEHSTDWDTTYYILGNEYEIDGFYEGKIDDARIYDRNLSQAEVDELSKNRYRELGDEVAWWPMNEGEGETVYDESGEGNHSEIEGANWTIQDKFQGALDGNRHTISDLYINRSGENQVGLFGVLGNESTVNKVGVEGNVTGKRYVGELAGTGMGGTVTEVYSTGKVEGKEYTGGLAGAVLKDGSLNNTYSHAEVNGSSYTGGLVGQVGEVGLYHNGSGASSSGADEWRTYYNKTSNVSGLSEMHIAFEYELNGQFSALEANVTVSVDGQEVYYDSSSNDEDPVEWSDWIDVKNDDEVTVHFEYYSQDGIGSQASVDIFWAEHEYVDSVGGLSKSYSAGSIEGGEPIGGLIGQFDIGSVSDSYSDENTTNQVEAIGRNRTGSDNVETLFTEEMQRYQTYSGAGWDIVEVEPGETDESHIWNIVDNETYPFFSWEENPLGQVDHIEISPGDSTITAGETIDFDASAYDQHGNLITDTDSDFTWENTTAVDSGLFDDTTAGEYNVTATFGGVTSTATTVIVQHNSTDSVEITPSSDQTITAGETIEFSASAYDEYGNLITDVASDFTWENTTSDNSGLFDNTTAGDHDVTATYGGVTSTATTVTVQHNSTDSVEITPSSDQTITAGETIEFSASAYDEYGNLITDVASDFTWENTTSDNSGLFDNTTAGDHDVTATYGGVTSTATTVTVQHNSTDSVEITPSTDQTITAGDTIDFAASAYDQHGNLITDTDSDFTWENTTDTGLFDKTETGDHNVTATYEGVISPITTVTVEETNVDYVMIYPETDQTITAGDTIDFSAEAYDQDDNLITDTDSDFTWENTTDTGLFDDTTAGEYNVTATYGGVTSPPTLVTVQPNSTVSVEIDPLADQTITAGDTIDFKAWANDTHGNVITTKDSDFTWENTTDTGLFDDTTAGDYNITATYDGVSSSPTMVTVQPAGADTLEVQPAEKVVTAGESVTYTSKAYDEYGNDIGDVSGDTTWVIDAGAGGSWETNVYTSENAGNWTVTAKYNGITKDASLDVKPANPSQIEIEPKQETIALGETITYYAFTYDEFGNRVENVTSDTDWSIEEGAGGNWTGNEYKSKNAGDWNVTGSYSMDGTTLTANASLTVLSEGEVWVNIYSPGEGDVVSPEVTVGWESKNAENHQIRLNEGGWINVGMNTTYTFENLEEGVHTVEVQGVMGDISDHDIVNFTVESVKPTIEIIAPEEDDVLPPDVTVKWTSENAEYHEIRLNEDEWINVSMDTSHTFTDLVGGDHFVEVRAVKGEKSVTDTVNFTVDVDLLYAEIISPEEGKTFSDPEVTVEWTSENADYHEIRLNEDGWINVSMDTSYTFGDLGEGEHFVEVRAVRGEESVTDTVNFTVDLDLPHTEIISPEEGSTFSDPEVTVEWTSENADYHEIRLNEDGWINVSMDTSYTFGDLNEGEHFVEVRAVRGGESFKDTVNFTVESQGLSLEIVSPEQGEIINVSEVAVEWTSENAEYHRIKREGLDWQIPENETNHTLTGLEDGEFMIEVKAVMGEENITKSVTITVDTTPPSVQIVEPGDGEFLNEDAVRVEWQGSDQVSGVEYYKIQLDGDEWIDVEQDTSYLFSGLDEGQHGASVRAFDSAGNQVTDNVTFIIDTTLPTIEITKPSEEDEIFTENTVTIEWDGDGQISGIETYELLVDGELIYEGKSNGYDLTVLEDGYYGVEVRAIDRAGNGADNGAYDTVGFYVDTTPPDLEVKSPLDNDIFSKDEITALWDGQDDSSGIDHYEISVDGDWESLGTDEEYTLEDLAEGNHTIEVRATDEAGHSVTESIEFMVDTIPPEVYFVSPEDGEAFDDDSITVKWNCSETRSGVDYYEVRIDDGDWNQVSEFEEYDFTDLSEGEHTVEVIAVDNAGNIGNATTEFEINTEDTSGIQVSRTCFLPLLLAIIIAILLIAGWYSWKKSEEEEELEKREAPPKEREVMTKSSAPSKEASESGMSISTAQGETGVTEESEWREDELESEESPESTEVAEDEFEEPSETEESEKTLEELSEEEEMDVDKLDVVEEFQKIKGIGSGIAHALYEEGFHSREELKEVEVDDIKAIEGIGLTQAELIHKSIQKDEEKTKKTPSVTEDDFKAHELGPMVKGREMKEEVEDKDAAPHIEDTDMEAQKIDSEVFEGETEEEAVKEEKPEKEAEEVETEKVEEGEEISKEITKDESLTQLSQLSGVGKSKAENLYESGLRTLDDLEGVSNEELQEVKGVGPALSEKILDSLEELTD